MDNRLHSIGLNDTGDIALGCQGEVIELAKYLSSQDAELRRFLDALVAEIEQGRIVLPVLSETLTRVLDLVAEPDSEVSDWVKVVELDVSLAIKVVGVANNAYFSGPGGPASSVHEALMRMGTRRAADVIVMTALRSQFMHTGALKQPAEDLWLRGMLTALTCGQLLEEIPPWQRAGFLLGTVQGIGSWAVLGFARTLEDRGWGEYALRREILDPVCDALEGVLGGLVIQSWGYSRDFALAVRHCKLPSQSESPDSPLVMALHTADRITRLIEAGWTPYPDAPDPDLSALLESLGLEADALISIVSETLGSFEVMSKL